MEMNDSGFLHCACATSVAAYTAVVLDSDGVGVKTAGAGDDLDLYGVSLAQPSIDDGVDIVLQGYHGSRFLTGRAAITAGALVAVTTGGKFVTATNQRPVYRAKTACAGDDAIFAAIPLNAGELLEAYLHTIGS